MVFRRIHLSNDILYKFHRIRQVSAVTHHLEHEQGGQPAAPQVPLAKRPAADVPGHWLLARLGKRVLRPGGAELSRRMIQAVEITDRDVVELAPGLGHTARAVLSRRPRSYRAVDRDPDALAAVRRVVAGAGGRTILADAAHTGLSDASADVVIGEAMLTMQGTVSKSAILAEVSRVLRPGGSYAIHELALAPDTLPDQLKAEIQQALARSIRVNARPLTGAEWELLLCEHGLVVEHVDTAPMALLRPSRLVADEGIAGAARFARNLLSDPEARRRVLDMRRTFRRYRRQLLAVAVVAKKPEPGSPPAAGVADAELTASRSAAGRR